MKRNLKLILMLAKLRLSHLMVFRLSFFGAFFVDGSMFVIQLLLFDVLYSQVASIGGWQRGEMIIFIGTFSLINALNMSTFFFGLISIPDKIRTGALDHYLTKPSNTLLRLSFEQINPGSLPLIAMSLLIIARGVSLLPSPPDFSAVMGYIFLVLLMTLLWYDLMLLLRTAPFFLTSAATVHQIEESLIELSMKVPGVVFEGIWKILFQVVLPYGLMATLPTQMLTGTLTLPGLAWGSGVAVLFTLFTLRFWKFGLSRYKSASS
jgi:ABC-2 type transport system permease protein